LTTWRLRDPSSLHWRQWDDGLVLFHAPSGDTHLLKRPEGEALLLLRQGPRDLDTLVRELVPGDAGGAVAAAVGDLLSRFEELGVVEADRG
jgi:PqqD family protein of HPr-rel-A system